jgi:hypothetical protein
MNLHVIDIFVDDQPKATAEEEIAIEEYSNTI